jgi:NitT/TauT family transport system permease protein
LLVFVALAGIIFGITRVAREWTGELRPAVEIDLSPWALPKCTLFSLSRGLVAYVFSLIFTLLYGYWAAKDRLAERVLTPLLDILQSVPVLGFLPGLVLALVAAFPTSNLGLELAAVAMIFTGQAWNMTFSFYQSLKSIPQDQLEAARHFRFTGWQRFRWVELPFSTMGLVWNSMMSMAGGWFFLMINEAFVLQDKDFRLPGIGSYMSVAVSQGNIPAMLWAILAMIVMIVALDQLLWRPILVVAQRYRVEETGQQELMASWFLDPLRQSKVLTVLTRLWPSGTACRDRPALPPKKGAVVASGVSAVAFVVLLGILGYGAWRLVFILREVSLSDWGQILSAALLTLGRVLAATAIGTLWTVPAGLAIGLSPRLSRFLQPLIQVAASFPAPMLFPLIILALKALGVTLDWGSILLMLLGTQWYILFNVVAGAMAIPADLKEAARSYRLTPGQRFRILYLPAIFSNLVTGWVTAAGGAWNASIVAEFVTFRGEVLTAHGIGASISASAAQGNFGVLAASVAVMSALVVLFNHLVWRRCYKMAAERFSLSK